MGQVSVADVILCQITNKAYADINAIRIQDEDFQVGSLLRTSYIRPGKLFTANVTIVDKVVGRLKTVVHQTVVLQVVKLISQGAH